MKQTLTVMASAARTATHAATIATTHRAGFFFINVSALTAGASIVFTIAGNDPVSGAAFTILTSAAIVATGMTVLRIDSALTAAANTIAKDSLPQAVTVTATHADSKSVTYSVGFCGYC
jgi:hypothetical protein